MGNVRSLGHTDFLQFNLLSASILEQSDTFAKQYGHEVKIDFVQQSNFHCVWFCGRSLYGILALR